MDKERYRKFIEERPNLWWWVRDRENLSVESIVEGVLSYGDIEDVRELFELMGREQVKEAFLLQIKRHRNNYRPATVNFFKRVFSSNA